MITKIFLFLITMGISVLSATSITPSGNYEILSELGRGGNGTVFLAKDESKRLVALKRVKSEEEYQDSIPKEFLHFFFQPDGSSIQAAHEFAISQLLHHDSIIQIEKIFTTTQENGQVFTYLVIEYVEGKSLSDTPPNSLTRQQAIKNVRLLLSALKHAFARGLLHEDLYTDNLMIDNQNKIKLIDIGSFELLTGDDPIEEKSKKTDVNNLGVFKSKTHLQHIKEIIFAATAVLQCADFDESDLSKCESKLLKLAKQDKFKSQLKRKITAESPAYFISLLSEIDSQITKKRFFAKA